MTSHSGSDTELLTEHFGYPPVSLLDDIINSINILAERALNSIEQGLLNTPPAALGFRAPKSQPKRAATSSSDGGASAPPSAEEEALRHEVENGTHQLETLLCASIDRNFDKFELYVMRNILCVRPEDRDWIRLGHYEGLDFGSDIMSSDAGEEEDSIAGPATPTVESVNRLRRRLQASQKLNCMLHAEKARNAALIRELRAVVGGGVADGGDSEQVKEELVEAEGRASDAGDGSRTRRRPFAFLHNMGGLADGDAETPLATTTAFTLSQLHSLRALSTSLRHLMPELAEKQGDGDDETTEPGTSKTWRRERVEYVETATRKHLENVRGLELGKNGEVRDGEWQGEGRDFAKGEVKSLENIASILGADTQSSSRSDEVDKHE